MNTVEETRVAQEKAVKPSLAWRTGQVVSADGTHIVYRQVGNGSGIVILHGGMRASQHYVSLAEAMAESCQVTIPDRRGRGLSGPAGDSYNIDKEMEDLSAILQETGAGFLFGHSAGGYFALEAALRLPIQRLALYEPAVSIHGSIPFGWVPAYERALAKNDPAFAFVQLFKALRLHPLSALPAWALTPFTRLMMRSEEGREIAALLPTGVWEIKEFKRMEQLGLTYERYQGIRAETFLICGAKSPAYLRLATHTLVSTIPHARVIELPGLDHNAPDQNAPQTIAGELKHFFA